jgi:mannose-1-phosphate guanylyltransferase/mannose-6-phosphate isomerase
VRRAVAPPRRRIHAVILAGGAGERFWPASRAAVPKFFLSVDGGPSLLEATLDRARRFAGEVWVVCGREHARNVMHITGIPRRRVIIEPKRRNTALAAGLAATRIAAEDPDAVLAVLPADHRIPDARAFTRAMRKAAAAADGADVLVTLGVAPTRPESGYGYIRVGRAAGSVFKGLHKVARFVEKPDAARARRFLRSGGHLWNAGIFVWGVRTFLEEVEAHAPEIHRALAPVRRSPRGRDASAAIEKAYRRAPSLPVDVAVLERSRRVWVLPVDFHWNDIGTWRSLSEELGVEPGATRSVGGDVIEHDASGNLVWSDAGRSIALVGVEGLAVIDTGDALLVSAIDRSADVKRVVEELKSRKRDDLL